MTYSVPRYFSPEQIPTERTRSALIDALASLALYERSARQLLRCPTVTGTEEALVLDLLNSLASASARVERELAP